MNGSRALRPTVLVINPGSTSTKVALFEGERELHARTLRHSIGDLAEFESVIEQKEFRERSVREFLSAHQWQVSRLSAVIARGGLMRPVESGVYAVSQEMLSDLAACRFGEHASNLGAIISASIARDAGCPAFIADPVVVDEMDDVARFSGVPEIPRKSVFHALNQKAAAREVAGRHGQRYEMLNLIVAHLGGGISVGAHRRGRVVDVNNALDGEGPFSPERAGTLPAGQLLDLLVSGTLTESQLRRRLTGGGGLVAYCGTNDLTELIRRIEVGSRLAAAVFDAMAYQIAKEIATHGATLEGDVDYIVLTGGMARNRPLVESISKRISFLAPVEIVPGEREMSALARSALAVLSGDGEVKQYPVGVAIC